LGIDGDRALKHLRRQRVLAGFVVEAGEQLECRDVARINREDLLVNRLGLSRLTGALMLLSEIEGLLESHCGHWKKS